jgi:2-dehydro-3-deoxyphosphogluconate aldolase/(4S)-4-hydroxy-2-oxoglutarate aldolase
MTDSRTFRERIAAQGVLPLYHHGDADVCVGIAEALVKGGLPCIEFTNRGPNALDAFVQLVKERPKRFPDAVLAAGTMRSVADAEAFIAAGADVLISPFFDEGVAEAAKRHGRLWIPGCLTPTEMHRCMRAGFPLVKLFPGNMTGPGYLEAIRPVMPELETLVTGGVEPTVESLRAWFRSGAMAVGMGSRLIPSGLSGTDAELDALMGKAVQLTEMVKEARSVS